MIHFIKSILSLGRFSTLSVPPSVPSVRQVPFDRISQRPKDEGREDGKEGEREGGDAMDCFAASRTDGCKGNQISPRDCLPSFYPPLLFRKLSVRPSHYPLALTKDWTSEDGERAQLTH